MTMKLVGELLRDAYRKDFAERGYDIDNPEDMKRLEEDAWATIDESLAFMKVVGKTLDPVEKLPEPVPLTVYRGNPAPNADGYVVFPIHKSICE
jgi:hypothetical protein